MYINNFLIKIMIDNSEIFMISLTNIAMQLT